MAYVVVPWRAWQRWRARRNYRRQVQEQDRRFAQAQQAATAEPFSLAAFRQQTQSMAYLHDYSADIEVWPR